MKFDLCIISRELVYEMINVSRFNQDKTYNYQKIKLTEWNRIYVYMLMLMIWR